ncbi:MAG: C25 family cysteine peptidase [Bacteroidales bacterium]
MIKKSSSLLFLFIMVCFSLTATAQQTITYTNNWGSSGFNLEKHSYSGVRVSFSVPQITLSDFMLDGQQMKTVEIPGVFLPNNEGAPNLPGTGRYIAIPKGASVSLEILEMRTEVIHNIDIAPSPRIPKETEDGLFYQKDQSIYSSNALYPSKPVQISEPTRVRGVDVVMLGITPFQYNPVTKDLIVIKDVRVNISFENHNNQIGENRLRSRWFDPLLQDMLLNPEALPTVNYNKSTLNTDDVGFEYLIIVPDAPYFKQWADSIKLFRQRQGILTGIKTLSEVGGNSWNAIESYLNNAYNTWSIPPVACLLIGDYGTNINNTIDSPIWDAYCVSDNIYGDVDDNSMPDIIMARMTAQDEAQLRVMVRKFIDYERNPPTSENFYNHPITALGWQTERWFQLCSEVIRGFWENSLGKNPVRINAVYDGDPTVDPWSTATNTNTVVNYFGPTGLNYITSTPQGIGGFSGGTAAQVNTAINDGSFILQHRDHGFEAGWGEPDYSSPDINGLHNTDLCFIMSVNCLTGKYNHSSEVFAEKFHRHTWNELPSGALGLIAASEVSYSFVNDAYIWGVYDNMWPEFMPAYGSTPTERGLLPAFGNAAGKYFLQQSSWPYNPSNKEVTYNLFHHHGDAFLNLYSEVPQSLTVTHNPVIYPGVTSFEVTANPGSLICLSLNGEILGTGIGTGTPLSITIPGNQLPPDVIDVVVTLQNHYRYEGQVMVIPPSGPYIIKHSATVNDINGNNNGLADFGENITLNIGMKNVGVVQGTNITVTLNTSDPNVTITDDSEVYGDIPNGSTITINDGFGVLIANTVTDGHTVLFSLVATDGTDSWTSTFHLLLNAPLLKATSVIVSDLTGNNNNRLDPGETVMLSIVTNNIGHSDAANTIGTLVSMDAAVTVNVSTYPLNTIVAGDYQIAEYLLEVSPSAVAGQNIMFSYTAASGNYQTLKYFIQTIGVVSEDWECNSFTHFNWNNPSPSWLLTTTSPYEGQRCVKSASIPNNGSTSLSITLDVIAEDSISFYRRVSSEANYDYLQFFIDNNMVGEWSGTLTWGRVAFPVTSGIHTFKWKYMKDGYSIGGSDAAWIDYIMFPPFGALPLQATATATPSTICTGNSTQLNVLAMGGIEPLVYQWSPTTGLNASDIPDPIASPQTSTIYTVTVTDANNDFQISTITVTVNNIADTPNTPTTLQTTLCQGSGSTLVSTGLVTGAFTYVWTLSPAAAGFANGSGTSAWVNWNASYSGPASVTVKSSNSCGLSLPSSALEFTVHPNPIVSLAPLENICINHPAMLLNGGIPAGGIYSGNGVTSNTFNPAIAGAGTWPITYTYTDNNSCTSTMTQPIYVDPCAGIDDISGNTAAILFPNPTQGLFTLRLQETLMEMVNIRITNNLGMEIKEITDYMPGINRDILIDLNGFAEGMYLITVETSTAIMNQKILLQGK